MIRNFNVAYFMASTDNLEDVTGFANKNEATFPILSDPTTETSAAYGVLSARGFAKRWTFYIDEDGVISKVDRSVSPSTAGTDLARHLAELNFPKAATES